MKVVVLGGYGLTGSCTVRDLVETSNAEVVIAGRNLSKALSLAEKIKSKRVSAAQVDASNPDDIKRVIKDADVVVNAVQYYYNLTVMKACLEAKVHYLDFGGLYHVTKKQLELDREFREANLIAILGMGAQPGISNIMARYAAENMDYVYSIRLRDGWIDLTENAPPFYVTWSFLTVMDLLTLPAVVFEDGEYREVAPLSRSEKVLFPEPVGIQEVYVTLHSEVLTLPISFKDKGIRYVDWMEGGPGFVRYKLLVDMNLTRSEPIKFKGVEISPREFVNAVIEETGLEGLPENVIPNDWEATKVIVDGKIDGKKATYTVEVIFPPRKEWRASCSQCGTGIPGSIVAQMIAKGEIEERGALPPEKCVKPKPFFEELLKRGIQVYVTLRKEF